MVSLSSGIPWFWDSSGNPRLRKLSIEEEFLASGVPVHPRVFLKKPKLRARDSGSPEGGHPDLSRFPPFLPICSDVRCGHQKSQRFPRQETAMLHCDLRVRWKVASDLRFFGLRFLSPEPFLQDFWRFGSVNAEIASDCDCAILVR